MLSYNGKQICLVHIFPYAIFIYKTMQGDQFPFHHEYDWNNKEFLGQGGFGEVYKVLHKTKNKHYAIKKMSMAKFDQPFKIQALKNQLLALSQIKSKHTVSMENHYLGNQYSYVVLQLCDSDLKHILKNNDDKLDEDWAVQIIYQLVQGFKVLVERGYIHRDIKPENILVKDHIYKLADYGFIRKVNNIDFQKLNQVCGTPFYMAPQLLYRKEYTAKCDIWSLGLVFYEILFGYSPWCNRHIETYKQSVVNKPVAFPYCCGIGQNTKDFIERCLQLDESDRISWKEIFNHPLIKQKKKGKPVQFRQYSPENLKILIRIQQSVSRKCIHVLELFKKYEKYSKMDYKLFETFINEIDPQISTYQCRQLFKVADYNHDQTINLEQFKQIFTEIDYRPVNDIASRRIEAIVLMAQSRNINIRDFFNLFDKDKSSKIDVNEFYSFIKYIAPQIPDHHIKLMWHRFDIDNSGYITMEQFISEVTRSVPNQQSNIGIQNYEKAKRNVKCMKDFLKAKKVTAQKFFGKANLKKHQIMTLQDFGPLVEKINYVITKEEIRDMFRLIDSNNTGTIEIEEIEGLLLS